MALPPSFSAWSVFSLSPLFSSCSQYSIGISFPTLLPPLPTSFLAGPHVLCSNTDFPVFIRTYSWSSSPLISSVLSSPLMHKEFPALRCLCIFSFHPTPPPASSSSLHLNSHRITPTKKVNSDQNGNSSQLITSVDFEFKGQFEIFDFLKMGIEDPNGDLRRCRSGDLNGLTVKKKVFNWAADTISDLTVEFPLQQQKP